MRTNVESPSLGSGSAAVNALQTSPGRMLPAITLPGLPRQMPTTEIQIFVAIVLLAAIFSYGYPDSFATGGTLLNMARVSGILLVVSIGQSFALIVGGFDISVGATMGLVSVISALMMRQGFDVDVAVALATLAGAVVGLINGIGISVLGVTPFVMTLGVLTSARGLADQLANGRVITGFPHAFAYYGRLSWWGIPSAAWIAVAALAVAWLILQRTRAGLYIFAIGGSRETTRVAGVFVELYEVLAYTLCGTMAGVGGIMLTSRVAVAQGSLGTGYELLSVATAVIGGVLIGGGVGRLTGVVLGVILVTVLNTGLDIAGVGAQQAAKDAGVTLTTDAGKGFMDPAAQITQVENALTHKPDALLINPSDPEGMAPTIDETIANGTPVFDVGTLSASTKSAKVVQDDYTQGLIAVEAVAKLLPQGGHGLLMAGPPNASWARRRVAGFLDGMKKYPNIKLNAIVSSDNDAADGLTKFSNAAQANPKFDFIYVTGSFVLQPQSIPAEYKKAVYIAGSLTSTTLEALRDGNAAAILPDFPISVGYIGLSLAVKKLNGDTIPQYNCAPVAAMYKAQANDPLWVDTSIMPADAVPVK
jgi:ribose/xylose/arabinose/galactoside ABC-type transport system permease subunit